MVDRTALIPVPRDELQQALAYALRFDERGTPYRQAVDDMAWLTAQTLLRQLDLSGYVVMKQPPATPPRTPAADGSTA